MRWCCTRNRERNPRARRAVDGRLSGRRLVVLEERGGREEDGTDEVGEVVRVGPDRGGVDRERAEAKQTEPMANRTPIHHAMARGAHQVEPDGVRRGCLRCQRDSHVTRVPSGRLRISRVTNGPKPRPLRRRQPSGTSTNAWAIPVTLSGGREQGGAANGPADARRAPGARVPDRCPSSACAPQSSDGRVHCSGPSPGARHDTRTGGTAAQAVEELPWPSRPTQARGLMTA